ncbi:hypothetical protein BVY01_00395 [bacterium I07]|nr:hypothetical protein BVY01_00395 [bacterium I07]
MQNNGSTLIVGIKISEKLRDQLDSSKESVKHLLGHNDSEHLQILEIDSDDYLTKTTTSSATLEELSNMCMNLKTMLKMICPKFSIPDDAIRIYALSNTTDDRLIY